MNENILNEAIIRKDLGKCLNEDRPSIKSLLPKPNPKSKYPKKRPKNVTEWTFADWFGEDLTGQTYDGDIDCNECGLTSLEGAPNIVNGDFYCNCNQLTSLEGAPRIVNGRFNCGYNQLTSLKGAPKEIGGSFECYDNKLTSLEGSPEKVDGSFNCWYNQLTSLKGAPEKVGGNFYCSNNGLISLNGAPEVVNGGFYCSNNDLTSLEGAPIIVNEDFNCFDNQFTSFEGAPEKVGGRFMCNEETAKKFAKELAGKNYNDFYPKSIKGIIATVVKGEFTFADWFGEDLSGQTYNGSIYCDNCGLTSLKGAPKVVSGYFHCWGNHLTSLEGAPKEVGGDFWCYNNQLTSLKGAPEKVGKDFHCYYNQLTSLEGAPKEVGGDFDCGPKQIFTEGFDKNISIGGYLDISLKSIDNIIDTIPDGCKVRVYKRRNSSEPIDITAEIQKLKSMNESNCEKDLSKCLNENADDVDLGNGWKLTKPEMGDGVGDNMYYFVAIEGITCKYADPELDYSLEEFCYENGIDQDDISIIGINATKGAVGTYCKGGKKGGVNWDSAIESAKTFIEKYQTVKKWMDNNGMETNDKRLVVYAIDDYAHNF